MRSWLNSTAAEGKVDWLCGNPPKDGYVSGVGAYNEKAGFLNAFSKSEIAAMKTVTQRSLVSHPEYNKGIVDGDANSDLLYYTDISEAVANYSVGGLPQSQSTLPASAVEFNQERILLSFQ